MNLRILKLAVILAVAEGVGSFPAGCLYKRTSYKDGEIVRTEDPCLSCVCQKGALECSRRVCGGEADPLPPGCFLLHKPNSCCPQLFCDETFDPTEIELRTGYKSKNSLQGNDCVINGSIYVEGSAVGSSQPCEYCYCVRGEMKCLKPRCLQSFEGCKPAYEKSSCCPTHYDCRDAKVNFLTAQTKHFVLNTSSRSLSSSNLENEKECLNLTESAKTDLVKSKGEQMKEVEKLTSTTAADEKNTEVTTPGQDGETTAPFAEDHVTTLGENRTFYEEPVTEEFWEESTSATEAGGNFSSFEDNAKEESDVPIATEEDEFKGIEISTEASDVSSDESSREVDDYDAYDYSEPRLPPSLPNLVIFPFVAADAVVKGEESSASDAYKGEGEKVDAHYVFHKDYFSPPTKTEGGFVPKEPPKSEESFYESAYFNKKQVESPSEGPSESPKAAPQTNAFPHSPNELNFPTFVNSHGTKETSTDEINMAFGSTLQSATPLATEANETVPLVGGQQTKKPVTVTYKNFIVDYYPHFLITTARGIKSEQGQVLTEEDFSRPAQKPQEATAPSDAAGEAPLKFFDAGKNSVESPTKTTDSSISPPTSETTLFDDEFTEFFPPRETTPATAITSASKKRKFSSKIKSPFTSTQKPKREKLGPKEEAENSLSVTEKADISSEKQKPVGQEEIMGSVRTDPPAETESDRVGLFRPPDGGAPPSENRISEVGGNERTASNPGTLLKLAGCNIYGMMYRVGKVIAELSGPCLECRCTDLGVQCSPLEC